MPRVVAYKEKRAPQRSRLLGLSIHVPGLATLRPTLRLASLVGVHIRQLVVLTEASCMRAFAFGDVRSCHKPSLYCNIVLAYSHCVSVF